LMSAEYVMALVLSMNVVVRISLEGIVIVT